ncbi:hypothetical protein AX16_000069 [Volvariella volvacea WC 439]|nr:hypothetical protein AX16_000069 [Volvariella volvacea WC 439]
MNGHSLSRVSASFQFLARHSSRSPTYRFSSLALDQSALTVVSSQHNYKPQDRQLDDLKESLSRVASPSRVWTHYTSLLSVLGHEKLPLELHQEVLRKCTSPSSILRASAARRVVANGRLARSHIHESRFQTIIRNIRAMGVKPHLDDYHFILQQFAAVGHDTGALSVYQELLVLGLKPRTRTFGLCLQAIAHRLSLPIPQAERSKHISETQRAMSGLITDMQKHDIPLTSVNLDLIVRILKETSDFKGFESLIKWGYGIDLSNPDCPPLEFYGEDLPAPGLVDANPPSLRKPLPFSTAALNTVIDCLGRFGNISKMIQAFEVLTQPLPQAAQHKFNSFDDDEDFGVFDSTIPRRYNPPHAKPNTTTYNILLRHLAQAGHAILLRHYLLQAIWLDKRTDRLLRNAIYNRSIYRVEAPHFSINRGTVMPVLGLSNRDKNLGLTRWLYSKIPGILKRKRGALENFLHLRDKLEARGLLGSGPRPPSEAATRPVPTQEVHNPEESGSPSSSPTSYSVTEEPHAQSTSFAPSLFSHLPSLARRVQIHTSPIDSPLAVDIDNEDPPPSPPPPKMFDVNLHISILERDLEEFEELASRLETVLGRTTQRVKERLGRRVWAGKDIYVQDLDRRTTVSKKYWSDIVGYRPRLHLANQRPS